MVSTTVPYRAKDVDWQLDGAGEVYRAMAIEVTKAVESEDVPQMGTTDYDRMPGTIKVEWSLTIDEVAGNFATMETWADGSTTHDLKISKGSATLTLLNAKCFDLRNTSSSGSTGQIVISGNADASPLTESS